MDSREDERRREDDAGCATLRIGSKYRVECLNTQRKSGGAMPRPEERGVKPIRDVQLLGFGPIVAKGFWYDKIYYRCYLCYFRELDVPVNIFRRIKELTWFECHLIGTIRMILFTCTNYERGLDFPMGR